ncbi:hypothetical protein GCM10010149_45960 [Nonomuraea roseoviolacea subsp. roseoviolacea]|uniref:Uncharacterized protein n=1 Tax=Nonomuraea roseoviolacea subsp. carminata TaxID=160689 RepID=A0ABT1KFV7_9ACTN|nr:hypothetical protein [Nonomuraea roseoviolacea]MCP2352477.1 hypothetical protein [Nonomuraea roseoviolacea subsp. carminata]
MNDHLVKIAHPRLRPGLAMEAPVDPSDFLLLFTDDTEARARLVRDDTGRPVLRVGARMRLDGTTVDEEIWTVRELVRRPGLTVIRLGDVLT